MRRPNPRVEPSNQWRVAMIVTKAPSEPWETVRRTLEAMLAQDFPHDTWLADEEPTEATRRWCRQNGVFLSCRKDIVDYNRESWPRRKRCKEGNLAYFYDTHGYRDYDFVSQLDADHVPSHGYLRKILIPFHDDSIGYVAAPSICDVNKSSSWSARGRLFAEAGLHGPLQAGYNNGWAPLCIGSHYAVRTAALKEIGGLGPELAEDHSTSLIMNAHGWQGAFQIDAIANGEGPATFADCMTQEYQWARSLTMILLEWTPKFWPGLSFRHKTQFLFSQLWYPLFSSVALVGLLIPIYCLIIDRPLVSMNYLTFMLLAAFLAITNILPNLILKRLGLLRPADSRVISWEEPLFTITRFPWSLLGVFNGVVAFISKRNLTFMVTPKGSRAPKGIPFQVGKISPYVILASLMAMVAITAGDVSAASGYYFLALLGASIMTFSAFAIIWMHQVETGTKWKHLLPAVLSALPSLVFIVAAANLRLGHGLRAILSPPAAKAEQQLAAPRNKDESEAGERLCPTKVCFGVYDPSGSFPASSQAISIDHYFIPWGASYATKITHAISQSSFRRKLSLITLEPWPWAAVDLKSVSLAAYKQKEVELLKDIANGVYDKQLIASLIAISRSQNAQTIVRVMHEMEFTRQYPWHTERPNEFIQAYRHVVDLSRRLGIKNLLWMWSPAGLRNAEAYWPGDSYVDYIGLSIYAAPQWNWGHAPDGENLSFETLLKWKYWVEKFNKPIILAEVGVTGSSETKSRWLLNASRSIHKFPKVVGWIYFNQQQPEIVTTEIGLPDWSLSKVEAAQLIQQLDMKAYADHRQVLTNP